MKPDWKDAPEWAQYLAMDRCGEWYWYEFPPNISDARWLVGLTGRYSLCVSDSWKQTLEKRPE